MKPNVGGEDRIIRLITLSGAVFFAWNNVGGFIGDVLWWVIGAVALFSAVVGICPIYLMMGLATNPKHPKHRNNQPKAPTKRKAPPPRIPT